MSDEQQQHELVPNGNDSSETSRVDGSGVDETLATPVNDVGAVAQEATTNDMPEQSIENNTAGPSSVQDETSVQSIGVRDYFTGRRVPPTASLPCRYNAWSNYPYNPQQSQLQRLRQNYNNPPPTRNTSPPVDRWRDGEYSTLIYRNPDSDEEEEDTSPEGYRRRAEYNRAVVGLIDYLASTEPMVRDPESQNTFNTYVNTIMRFRNGKINRRLDRMCQITVFKKLFRMINERVEPKKRGQWRAPQIFSISTEEEEYKRMCKLYKKAFQLFPKELQGLPTLNDSNLFIKDNLLWPGPGNLNFNFTSPTAPNP